MTEIWFWQRMVTPHMANLAASLARKGQRVVYVAEEELGSDRRAQGWVAPNVEPARLIFAPDGEAMRRAARSAPSAAVHILQGLRANGYVADAQTELRELGALAWVIMETVDDEGLLGFIKRRVYSSLFRQWRSELAGVLAIGDRMPAWVARRGFPSERVFPFCYFLREPEDALLANRQIDASRFRFIFVGQSIPRKRLDLLVHALHQVRQFEFELTVVGSGPLETEIRARAEQLLPGRVRWVGKLPLPEAQREMADADCLVLPSRHDGWGAVVSEALQVGTPVICSDRCGAAAVVRESTKGAVFASGDVNGLVAALTHVLSNGRITSTERLALANWSSCLGSSAGAEYLLRVLASTNRNEAVPPWLHSRVD